MRLELSEDTLGGPIVDKREFVFFDNVETYGHLSGVIQVDLTAVRLTGGKEGVAASTVPVCDLRCSISGALALRAAIDEALKMAQDAARNADTETPKPN